MLNLFIQVGQVDGETQRLQVKDLQEGSEYMVRIMARNEVGVSDPLEPEDPVKMIRPPGNFSKILTEVMIFPPYLFLFIL